MPPEITRVEHFDDRFYRISDGKSVVYYPSVTTKLGIVAKPFLAKWRGDIGNREADMRLFESQERGTRIHSAWETLCNGGTVLYNPPRNPLYIPEEIERIKKENNGFVEVVKYQDEMLDVWKLSQFMEIVKPKILSSEQNVYSHKYREAGTMDTYMEIKEGRYPINGITPVHIPGGKYVVDLKTGSMISDEAHMQTAAYANCVIEMGIGEVDGTLILHTGAKNKKGIAGFGVALRTKDDMRQDFKDFRNASALWERKNKDIQPRVFDFPSLIKLEGLNETAEARV